MSNKALIKPVEVLKMFSNSEFCGWDFYYDAIQTHKGIDYEVRIRVQVFEKDREDAEKLSLLWFIDRVKTYPEYKKTELPDPKTLESEDDIFKRIVKRDKRLAELDREVRKEVSKRYEAETGKKIEQEIEADEMPLFESEN